MTRFTENTIYSCRSICDHDCIWTYQIIARTEKTVSFFEVDPAKTKEIKKCRINIFQDVEFIRPLGTYSMAPILTAEKIVTP